MKPKQAHADPRRKPRQPGSIGSMFLAMLVHAAFFSLIVLGVTWQSRPALPVEAELWDKLPPAPVAKAPEPKVVEPKPPEPKPPEPEPRAAQPPKPVEERAEPPKPDPAIAKKLEREKREAEKRAEKKKEEEAKKKREKEEEAKKKREDEKKRVEEERARIAAAEKAREAMSARQSEIDRYKNAIVKKIKDRANVPSTVTGHPVVQVRIRVLPGGEVLDIAVTRSSGNPTYDAAIERGARSASPLPVPEPTSELFPLFRDLILNITFE